MRHVVRVEESSSGSSGQAVAAEHLDVCPGDEEDRCTAILSSSDGVDGLVTAGGHDRVRGEEGSKVLSHAYGSTIL